MTTAKTITMAVSRAVSSLLGHTDLRSSDTTSCRNRIGLTRPTLRGVIGDWLRCCVFARATEDYRTSRWVLCPRQREQYFRNSIRWVSFRRFFIVA